MAGQAGTAAERECFRELSEMWICLEPGLSLEGQTQIVRRNTIERERRSAAMV